MRSELLADPGGDTVVLLLLNYADYPVENITVQLLERFTGAQLLAPGTEAVDLEIFEHGDGTELDIELIETSAAVVLSR